MKMRATLLNIRQNKKLQNWILSPIYIENFNAGRELQYSLIFFLPLFNNIIMVKCASFVFVVLVSFFVFSSTPNGFCSSNNLKTLNSSF